MPKAQKKERRGAAAPYAQALSNGKVANNIFKMNTDVGQHVLKNPGVAQAIVDKAELKQSDVLFLFLSWVIRILTWYRLFLKSALVQVILLSRF